MSIVAWNKEEPAIFRYGLLSSRTSEALSEYLDTGRVSDRSQEVLQGAYGLLKDIVWAQQVFGEKKKSVAPSELALDAFSCALEVIVAHKEDFGVTDMPGLIQLFETLHQSLVKLTVPSKAQELSREDVQRTKMFFRCLSKLMLAQLSVPYEEGSTGISRLR